VASNHSGPIVTLLEQLAQETEPTPDPSVDLSALLPQERGTDVGENLVFFIQRSLKELGSDLALLDGKMGPNTRAAIEDYQARHGLTVDGHVTEGLLAHLRETLDSSQEQVQPERKIMPSSDLANSLPELGPVKVAVRLSLDDGAYRFENLNLTLGRKKALWVDAAGTLGAFRPDGDVHLEEMALTMSFALPSSQIFAQMFPPGGPEFREIRGRFDLKGTTEALSISDLRLTAEGPDGLIAAVNGRAAKVSFATGFRARGLAFDLDARWPNTEGVYRLFDLDLPELGPVRARANLMDKGETFSLTEINVAAGSPDMPLAQVSGQVGDMLALKEIMLTGEFDVSTATLLDLETVIGETRLGNVHGQFNLSDTDGSIGLEALSAEIEDTKLLSLSVNGLFDDIKQRDELRLEATLSIPDVPQLGREFGFEIEHIDSLIFQGEVSGSEERFNAEGHARLGETDITGTLSGTLKGERPSLRAKLYSPLFRFADVGLVPQPDALEATSKSVLEEPAQGVVFDEVPIPFEALKQFDLDLDVLLEDIEGVHVDADKAEGRLDVVDGVLRVDPLSFNFVGGRVDLTLLADANKDPPELHVGLEAADVDLGDFLSQTKVEVPLDGELELLVDLRASGHSPRALASSLEGEFDMAIERGHVLTSLLDLTTSNPATWLFTESARNGYSDLNCLILRFDLQDGVAESQTLLLDTPNVLALGEGRIDLRQEIIDVEVDPQAKRRRLIELSTPFAIRGPLANPSVEVSSGGAAVRMAGQVLLSPLNLLGSLLPFVSDDGMDDDSPCLALQEDLQRQ
jgi:uncharacterized protein involved in outer membrane biogenesis/peptidoglycan hydrolase-like protein with peptidoglycan-binding domain